jgi:hypothetical protein
MNKKLVLAAALLLIGSLQHAAPLGFLEPYNFMIESEVPVSSRSWQWNFQTQSSVDMKSFNYDGLSVNSLQIYEPMQNALGLYQGAENSLFTQMINSVAAGAGGGMSTNNDGYFIPTGTLSGYQVAFLSTLRFHKNCYFKVSLPVYNLQLSDVAWKYAGNSNTFSSTLIEDEMVTSFLSDAKNNFGLDLSNWTTSGLGDLALLCDYIADFPQGRVVLRNVKVHVRLGLTFPTGQVADENAVLSQPLGADGSVTLPFGGGLDLNLGRYLQTGLRAQFSYIWGNAKERRIKTFEGQTALLYPTTAWVFKNYGITQLFDLYAQIYNPIAGLSFKAAYEYTFKPQSTISVQGSGTNMPLVNSDLGLEEQSAHNMIFSLTFDSGFLEKFDKVHPQVGLYYKLPFNGSLMNLASTVGLQVSLDW